MRYWAMAHEQTDLSERRRRGSVVEIIISVMRGGADRRRDRWSVLGAVTAIAILVGFVAVTWALLRLAFAG